MTEQHYELRLAMACYFQTSENIIIPSRFHDEIITAYAESGLEWNPDQAAALVLYSAHYEGILHPEQLTIYGHRALAWAEEHLGDFAAETKEELS
jgi:hypothetical protein